VACLSLFSLTALGPGAAAGAPVGGHAGTPDPGCNGGRPQSLGTSLGTLDGVLVAPLTGNDEAIGLVYTRGGALHLRIEAFTATCQELSTFGRRGVADITVPAVADRTGADISTMTAGRGGTLLLGGTNGAAWLLGRVLADGRLDPTFGRGGWVALTPPPAEHGEVAAPEVESAVQRDGAVLAAGNDGGAHCCVQPLVAEVSGRGRPDPAFGHHGWARTSGVGSFSEQVLAPAGGPIVMATSVIFMGCGGTELSALTPAGLTDGPAQRELDREVRTAKGGASFFLGTLFDRASGRFGLVGGGAAACVGSGPTTAQSFGRLVGFLPQGAPDPSVHHGTPASFASPPALAVWAATTSHGDVVSVVAPFEAEGLQSGLWSLEVREFSPDGSLRPSFGQAAGGVVALPEMPAPGSVASAIAVGVVGGDVVVAAMSTKGAVVTRLLA